MEFTGERVVPGKVEPDLYNEHVSRYYFAQPLVKERVALDLGCGTGYGAALLAKSAKRILALDISRESVTFARENYAAPNLEFLVADCCRTALSSGTIDTLICFEVIEHLEDQEALMEEIRRLLRPGGVLVISTPNRVYYTEERKQVNPFHLREFDFAEFSTFLRSYFQEVHVAFQNHVASIFVGGRNPGNRVQCHMDEPEEELERTSHYFVAVCSQTVDALADCSPLVFLPSTGNLLREKDRYIGLLEARTEELNQKVLKHQQEYDAQSQWCSKLSSQLEERTEWAIRLGERTKELDSRLSQLHGQYQLVEQELRERSAWAQRLSAEALQRDQRIASLQAEFDERSAWALRLNEELKLNVEKLDRIRQSKLFRLGRALGGVPKI